MTIADYIDTNKLSFSVGNIKFIVLSFDEYTEDVNYKFYSYDGYRFNFIQRFEKAKDEIISLYNSNKLYEELHNTFLHNESTTWIPLSWSYVSISGDFNSIYNNGKFADEIYIEIRFD